MDGFTKARNSEGRSPPPVANKNDQHNLLLLSKHGDDVTFAPRACKALKKRGRWGWRSPPRFANKMIRTTFHYCKHGDDMALLYRKHYMGNSIANDQTDEKSGETTGPGRRLWLKLFFDAWQIIC